MPQRPDPSSSEASPPAELPLGGPSPAVVRAVRRILGPLVRFLVAKGITFPFLSELLKSLYVEVADRDFRLGEGPPTDSRVTLITGVHRKDVARLRKVGSVATEATDVVPLGAQVVGRWLGDPRYLAGPGQPLALPRLERAGGERSFEALVTQVNKDIRSRVLLDDWLHLGLVRLDEQDVVHLNVQAFVPAAGSADKLFYFAHQLHDHAAAAVHNLVDPGSPFLDRSVHYGQLDAADVQRLQVLAAEWAMKSLVAVNQAASEMLRQGTSAQAANHDPRRFTFGVYFFQAPDEDGESSPAGRAPVDSGPGGKEPT